PISVERSLAGHSHGAFQPADRAHWFEAALAQKLSHDVSHQQVVFADEYAAPHAADDRRSALAPPSLPAWKRTTNTLQAPFLPTWICRSTPRRGDAAVLTSAK